MEKKTIVWFGKKYVNGSVSIAGNHELVDDLFKDFVKFLEEKKLLE